LAGEIRVVAEELSAACSVVANAGTAAVTNAVVASAVVLLPGDCVTPIVPVGRVGVPVKVGEAKFDFRSSAACKFALPETAPVMSAKATEVAGTTPPTLTTQEAYVPDPV
jgi:hypothetical protein